MLRMIRSSREAFMLILETILKPLNKDQETMQCMGAPIKRKSKMIIRLTLRKYPSKERI